MAAATRMTDRAKRKWSLTDSDPAPPKTEKSSIKKEPREADVSKVKPTVTPTRNSKPPKEDQTRDTDGANRKWTLGNSPAMTSQAPKNGESTRGTNNDASRKSHARTSKAQKEEELRDTDGTKRRWSLTKTQTRTNKTPNYDETRERQRAMMHKEPTWDARSVNPTSCFTKYTLLLYKIWRMALHNKISTAVQLTIPWLFVAIGVILAVDDNHGKPAWIPADDMFILFGFFFIILSIPREINQEKEKRIKEAMRMMGVGKLNQWLAWFTKYIILIALSSLWITLLLKSPGTRRSKQVAHHTSSIVIFLVLICWGICQIAFGFMMSAMTSTASAATAATAVSYILTYVPYLAALPYNIKNSSAIEREGNLRSYLCYAPNSAVALGFDNLAYAERFGWNVTENTRTYGYTLKNLDRKPLYYNEQNYYDEKDKRQKERVTLSVEIPLDMEQVFAGLILMTFVFLLVTWYVEAVFPGEYGVPEKPWFFLTKTYWCGNCSSREGDKSQSDLEYKKKFLSKPNNEADPAGLTAGINICGLSKKYDDKYAVEDLHLKMFEGQITAFLGHNGAGKTTTMSMITGFIPPTSGTAYINGLDINTSMTEIRASLGFCPQHDILFDNLTVEEHLYFFGALKGCPSAQLKREIAYYIGAADLTEKTHKLTKTLSGGQKRKLSVCISLIAKSKIVILDEPTSGMDPSVRRQIWDLLQAQRAGRTMLLSTHFMDEADHLGDRIAMIFEGELQCCGSSLFLKRQYTPGYTLTMHVNQASVQKEKIDELVRFHIPAADFKGQNGAELTYYLPTSAVSSFSNLFTSLEEKQSNFGVFGFGAAIASQEKVFQRVAELKAHRDGKDPDEIGVKIKKPYRGNLPKNTGNTLLYQQFKGMVGKRLLSAYRDIGSLSFQLGVPLIFTILAGSLISDYATVDIDDFVDMTAPNPHLALLLGSWAFQSVFTFGYAFLASSFISFLVAERTLKAKHSQLTSGAKWYTFWLSNFFSDMLIYTVPAIVTVVTIKILGVPYVSDGPTLYAFFVLLIFYGISMISQTYVLQFLFTQQSSGFTAMCIYNILTVNILYFLYYEINIIQQGRHDPKKDKFTERPGGELAIEMLFAVLTPNFMLAYGIIKLYVKSGIRDLCENQVPGSLNRVLVNAFGDTEENNNYFTDPDSYCNYDLRLLNGERKYEEWPALRGAFLCCWDPPGIESNINLPDFRDEFNKWRISNFSLESPGIGSFLIVMSCQALFWWIVLYMIETSSFTAWCFSCRPQQYISKEEMTRNEQRDSDVFVEQVLVLNKTNDPEQTPVVVSGLTKYYGAFKAVDGLYLQIDKSECFGLLGVNGAGKTTTFRMLTGEELISGGNAYINGHSLGSGASRVQSDIGYCPQFDALLDFMTGEEMLYMFARIRGIPEHMIPSIVTYLVEAFDLTKHRHKQTRKYSGGNKRKLSTAIAILGDPPVVFLDEPTTGMDPIARRRLWTVIGRYRKEGNVIILTSHSMEEAEALCTRMAIMVNGKFRCMGTAQHLKTKFGDGYSIIARVKQSKSSNKASLTEIHKQEAASLIKLKKFVEEKFPGCKVVDEHLNVIQYHIPKKNQGVGKIFNIMEDAKTLHNIEDYSVSQTSIEQVFLNFAREQREDRDDASAGWFRKSCTCACCLCLVPEYIYPENISV